MQPTPQPTLPELPKGWRARTDPGLASVGAPGWTVTYDRDGWATITVVLQDGATVSITAPSSGAATGVSRAVGLYYCRAPVDEQAEPRAEDLCTALHWCRAALGVGS